ncbi:MAG TPA: hypothetical protein VH558_04900 [Pseudolabrys sp.]|jgi:hypothetical protein
MLREFVAQQLEVSLQKSLKEPRLRLTAISGERPAADERREPWIPIKYGAAAPEDWLGVVPTTVQFERTPGATAEHLELVVKVNPKQGLARTLIPWIIEHKKIVLDRPYWKYRRAAESDDTGGREAELYLLAKLKPELCSILPRCYGTATDSTSGERALFLELLTNASRLDASGALADWPPEAIDSALKAAAGWQAAFWNARSERVPWAGPRPITQDMIADEPLWRGLLDDAHKRFPDLITERVWRRRHHLIDRLGDWHRTKDRLPATLAHNDFNQRNVGFRPDVVVLDWELVEFNTAHRDIVELLTFVLPSSADRRQIDAHVEKHRQTLVALGVTEGVDRDAWMEGFRCELKAEAIDRIGLQLLFAAQFPLAYLSRINRNIEWLLDVYA